MSSIGLISENDNSTVLAEYTGLNRVATSFQSEDALEKELIKTLVDKIIIDQSKNVEIVYKFKVLDNVVANLDKKEN